MEGMKILLVEDNLDDIELTKRALSQCKVKNPVFIARDGQEAIDYIFHKGKYSEGTDAPVPNVIILDLKLPRMDGFEVLKRIKEDNILKRIPIIMLTTSKRDEDVIKSYDLGVNSYIIKPVDFDKFIDTIQSIQEYWGDTNMSPVLQ